MPQPPNYSWKMEGILILVQGITSPHTSYFYITFLIPSKFREHMKVTHICNLCFYFMYSLFVSNLKSTFGHHKLMKNFQRQRGKESERGEIERERREREKEGMGREMEGEMGEGRLGEGNGRERVGGREEGKERERDVYIIHYRQQSNSLDG